MFGNVVRILSICIVGSVASPSFATGFYHDYSGYVVFAVAIAMMVLTGSLLGKGVYK
jgi:exosortase/archaeosortase family protein